MAQPGNRAKTAAKGGVPGGGRRRTPPPVKKPFPWGVAATAAVLVLLLGGILVYAVVNAGAGYVDPLKAADNKVPGVVKFDKLSQGHKGGILPYPQSPPVGGEHNGVWSQCNGNVYTQEIPKENAVHSLEHGAAWVTYRPDLPKADVAKLADLVQGTSYRLMSPYPGLKEAVSLQAWGRQLQVQSVTDPRIKAFLEAYTNGPQAPEKGATCSGGTTATGSAPVGG